MVGISIMERDCWAARGDLVGKQRRKDSGQLIGVVRLSLGVQLDLLPFAEVLGRKWFGQWPMSRSFTHYVPRAHLLTKIP
jgi:hypothetical protein